MKVGISGLEIEVNADYIHHIVRVIESRKPIQDAMERLQEEAPQHFGGTLLETDIYDFAAFARKYGVDPILEIHCIFVMGHDKCNLYAGPNPKIPDKDCRHRKYAHLESYDGYS